jgi:hypothetical protein
MRSFIVALLAVLTASQPVLAWSAAGHKIIASIAFRQLTPEEQDKVIAILRNHPRFEEDFSENDDSEWLFQQAAIWPDIARGFSGEDRETYHRPNWHYINRPVFLSDIDAEALEPTLEVNLDLTAPAAPQDDMNIIQTIRSSRNVLSASEASAEEKAVMLAWLFHCVGDIHQPMHSAAFFSQGSFPNGDRGGNSVKTTQRQNLHSLWDRFPGGNIAFRTAKNRAIELHTGMAEIGNAAATSLDEEAWLNESHDLASSIAYGPEVMTYLRVNDGEDDPEPLTLSEEYLSAGGTASEKRLVEAGYRLGAILKQLVAE